jgi:hypothetical protein
VLCFKLIGFDRRPSDRMLPQDQFDLVNLPTVMPKLYSPVVGSRQGSEKPLKSLVVAFQIGRKLNQYRAKFTRLMKRFKTLEHGHQYGTSFRLEATDMGDFSVGLW